MIEIWQGKAFFDGMCRAVCGIIGRRGRRHGAHDADTDGGVMGRHGAFQADQGAKPGARAPDLSTAALPPGQDFKGYLEMILQSYHTGRISYHTFESVDNGNPGLRCNLSLGQQHHNIASGFGSSKEEAEQRAARVCLAAIEAGTLRLRPK